MGIFSRKNRSQRQKQQQEEGEETGGKAWAVLRLFQAARGQRAASPPSLPTTKQCSLPIPSPGGVSGGGATVSAASAAAGETDSRLFSNQNYTPRRLAPRRSPAEDDEDSDLLMPSTHPLCRYIAAARARHNANKSPGEEAKERELQRYKVWQRERPHFRFGPRVPGLSDEEDSTEEGPGGEGDGGGRRASQADGSADTADDNIIALPPRYAFVYQDGKFVEREVNRWPKPLRNLPHTRYRVQEPYASAYGRRYHKRLATAEHILTMRHRLIYQNPIYRLPRRIMEENKSRLMIRHSLKDTFEGSAATGGPQKIHVGEREQTKMIKKLQEKANLKEAEKLVNYTTAKKSKQNAS